MNGANIIMQSEGIRRDIPAELVAKNQLMQNQILEEQIQREKMMREQLAGETDVQARIDALVQAGDYKSANTLAQMLQRQGAAAKSGSDIDKNAREQMYKEAEVVANAFQNVDINDPNQVGATLASLYNRGILDDEDIQLIQSDPNQLHVMIEGATNALEARRIELSEQSGERGERQLQISEAELAGEYGMTLPPRGGAAPTAPAATPRATAPNVAQRAAPTPKQAIPKPQGEDLKPTPLPKRSDFPGGRKGEQAYIARRQEIREENKYKEKRREAIRDLKLDKRRFQAIARGYRRKATTVRDTVNSIKEILKGGSILPKTGPAAGAVTKIPLIPADAKRIEKKLKTLESLVGFGELQTMRNNSKTGGAVGNLSEREFSNLASVLGNLDITNEEIDLEATLDSILDSYESGVMALEADLNNWESITAEFLPGGIPEQVADEGDVLETYTDDTGVVYIRTESGWHIKE